MALRICRVTNALYPDVIGGHAIFCDEMSRRQADLGHKIEVFTSLRKGLPRHQKVKKGYTVTRFEKVWMPWDSLGMKNPVTPCLYRAVAMPHWQIVDAHSHLFWITAIAVKAAVDTQKPVVTTVHGLLAQRDWLANFSQKSYLLSVGAWLLRQSSRVVCLTKSEAEAVVKLGVRRSNVSVIPTAVDPSLFHDRRDRRETIVWVGRMVAEKSLETLLEAIALVRQKMSPQLLVVGDGPMRNRVVARCHTLGISDLVVFARTLDRLKVAEVLSHSGIFVLSSVREGLPLTLLEAMASANTVVASDLPSLREVLGDAGLYFKPRNSNELASVLLQALADPEVRRQKGRLAREIVEARFSWKVVLPMLDELYGEVAGA